MNGYDYYAARATNCLGHAPRCVVVVGVALEISPYVTLTAQQWLALVQVAKVARRSMLLTLFLAGTRRLSPSPSALELPAEKW